jgi:hypothetical protein
MTIVTWTQPYQAAHNEWRAAEEHLEFRRWDAARVLLRSHLRHVQQLIRQIDAEEQQAAAVLARQEAFRLETQRGPEAL